MFPYWGSLPLVAALDFWLAVLSAYAQPAEGRQPEAGSNHLPFALRKGRP